MSPYQLKPLSVGDILDTALGVFRHYFGTLISVAIVCLGAPTVLAVYVKLGGGPLQRPGLALLATVLQGIGGIVAGGAVVQVISTGYLGHEPMVGEALATAFGKFGKLLVAGFAKVLVIGLAAIALIVPGIIVACGYAVVVQVVMLEHMAAGTDALGRSWQLTKGFKGKALVLGLVTMCIVYVPVIVASAMAEMIPGLNAMLITLGDVLQLLVMPAFACVFTLFYYDLRVRKEAFDLEQLSAHLHAPPEPASA